MWDLPRPGVEPVSPALTGGFLTTAPPGKSSIVFDKLVSGNSYVRKLNVITSLSLIFINESVLKTFVLLKAPGVFTSFEKYYHFLPLVFDY